MYDVARTSASSAYSELKFALQGEEGRRVDNVEEPTTTHNSSSLEERRIQERSITRVVVELRHRRRPPPQLRRGSAEGNGACSNNTSGLA
jgi:hypothetical protein